MRPVNESISPLQGDLPEAPNDSKDKIAAVHDKSPKMYARNEQTHLLKQQKLSQVLGSPPLGGDLPIPSGSGLVASSRGKVDVSEVSSVIPISERKISRIDLANHVSLQIFSAEKIRDNKNVILFLHGGPDLSYNSDFDRLTSWSLAHGYPLVAPEIAGSDKPGLTSTSDSFTNPPNYVRDFQAVIQYLRQQSDFKEKAFCVIAHSWGGFQLASFLTDKSVASEDKNFIKQIVFMSPNLDSAHTRIFEMHDRIGGPTFEVELSNEMTRRHAGEKSASAGKIDFFNNPVMKKNLNEEISPFYRLEQMPKEIPCLFIHPTKDGVVPASQSLAAMEKINRGGGNAKIVMTTNGDHAFFKAGQADDLVMATCMSAIDSLINNPDSLDKVRVDDESVVISDLDDIEKKIKEKDDRYESQSNLLREWHEPGSVSNVTGKKNKIQVLKLMQEKKEALLRNFEQHKMTSHDQYRITLNSLAMIKQALET